MNKILMTAVVSIAILMGGCAAKSQQRQADWALAAQNAETAADHEQLADHYDELAKNMQEKADEEKSILADYQRRPHRYGRRVKDLRARSTSLVRDYETTAADARAMGEYHRQMASELH